MATKKLVAMYDQCSDCHGTGKTESRLPFRVKKCGRCRGTGFVRRRRGMVKEREEDK